ncbi:hypothetical protein QO004_006088 [Rhizobium mesoamericanum]|nr:hypothetical protein [Rhizobium mesoamericanum]
MIVLLDVLLINEYQLRNDRAALQCALPIEICDVTHEEAIAVERDSIAARDEPSEVGLRLTSFRNTEDHPFFDFDRGARRQCTFGLVTLAVGRKYKHCHGGSDYQ